MLNVTALTAPRLDTNSAARSPAVCDERKPCCERSEFDIALAVRDVPGRQLARAGTRLVRKLKAAPRVISKKTA